VKAHSYLPRPNHLISKPIIAAYVLMGNEIKGFAKEDWLDFEFIIKVWNMI